MSSAFRDNSSCKEGGYFGFTANRVYEDKGKGILVLRATSRPYKTEHFAKKAIRLRLLWQSKLPPVEVHRILYDPSWDPSYL